MYRNLRLLLVCGTLALGLFVPGVVCGEEDIGIDRIPPVLVVESVPQTDSYLLEEESITLEEFRPIEKSRNVCGLPCGHGWPPVTCTQACGEGASCYEGFCLLW